jgi:hypothetical protein
MNKNLYMVAVLFVLSTLVAFSGTTFWDDGEIVRGTKINYALNEKVDTTNAAFIQLAPQAAFATSAALVGTIYKNADGDLNHLATGTTWQTLIATTTGLSW